MRIEKISQKDFKEVSTLIKKEFPYLGKPGQKIESRLARPGVFIFTSRQKNGLAGFIDVSISGRKGIVNGFSVKENFRKQGIGARLLEFGINFLKENGAQEIMLLVKKENLVAKKMYVRAGFRFLRVHPKKIDGATVEEMGLKEKEVEKFGAQFVA